MGNLDEFMNAVRERDRIIDQWLHAFPGDKHERMLADYLTGRERYKHEMPLTLIAAQNRVLEELTALKPLATESYRQWSESF